MKYIVIVCLIFTIANSQIGFLTDNLRTIPWPFTNCGSDTDPFSVQSVTMPNAPAKGANASITVTGIATEMIDAENLNIQVEYDGVFIFNGNCTEKMNIPAGKSGSYSYSVVIPTFSPSGTYNVQLIFQSTSNYELSCTEITFNL